MHALRWRRRRRWRGWLECHVDLAQPGLEAEALVERDELLLVRLALHEPSAIARTKADEPEDEDRAPGGVVVDISRKRVLIDYQAAPLTFKEFELLQFLVVHKGETISREAIIKALWREDDLDIPNERTIDVHVRRLRSKLGRFEDIVRTVRGVGYRYDTHADVTVMHAGTPSPDLF